MIPQSQIFKSALMLTGVFLFFTYGLMAQKEKIAFEKYGVAEGLPEEYVSSMVQDDQGFIWATTQNGLVKFDGYQMKVIRGTDKNGDSTKLQQRNLNGGSIKSKDGKIWLGAARPGGIASYDPETEKFRNYLPNPNNPKTMPFGGSELLFEDSKNNIWFTDTQYGQDTTVIARLDTKTHSITTYPYKTPTFKISDILLNLDVLEFDADGTVWLRDDMGNVRVFNRKKDSFELVIPSGAEIPGSGIKDTIQSIIKGNNEHFLLNGQLGFYIWDPVKRESVKSYTNLDKKDLSFSEGKQKFLFDENKFRFAFEDKQGHYWAQFEDGILHMIDPLNNSIQKLTFGEGLPDLSNMPKDSEKLMPIFQNLSGIWFLIYDSFLTEFYGFLYYKFETNSFTYYDGKFNDKKNLMSSRFYRMIEDQTGLLWLNTRPNFYKESPKRRKIEQFKHDVNNPLSIPSDSIYELLEDGKNRLWIGTEKGVSLKLPNDQFQKYYFRNNQGVITDLGDINKLYEDSIGQIWVGSNDHGLLRLNENKQEFEHYNIKNGITSVRNIQEDVNGNIWVSVLNQGVYILDSKTVRLITKFEQDTKDVHGLLSDFIRVMFLDSKGTLWLGDTRDNEYGLFKYLEEDNKFKSFQYSTTDSLSLSSNEIRSLMEDDLQRIWIGTDGGLNLYDHEADVIYRNKREFLLPSVGIRAKAGNDKMWVMAYSGGGLALVGPDINDVEMFGENKGLLHNDVNDIVLDDFGHLWLPTERGLSVFDTLTKTFSSYFENDGYQTSSHYIISSLKTKNGDIWIGGENGLNRIVPSEMFKKDSTLPEVLITSMGVLDSVYSAPDGTIFKQAVSYTDQVNLKHWQKDLSFEFVALHYLRSEDNLYSWKLENYDNKWSTPSKQRQVVYTNLSPGKYTFRVKGSNADGIWNEEGASLEIIIAPPWWLTWWAYVIYAIIIGLIGLQIHKFQKAKTLRIAKQKTQEKELAQAKEIEKAYTELKSTQAQLIQSEKMASLGELTAGIAHEIQNPLNFVNNFSEVNSELIEEMKEELEKGNMDEVRTLAKDIDENEQKIMFHGKRADSIVKGMLQHSRSSNGKKEPTNINALADEYLRLAYHGLRAKDKSFNATMKTDFDQSITEINIVSQDIGRVVLNLITNAFYVVDEKKKSGTENYEPTVTVSTKKEGKNIKIKVIDNANGIPDEIFDKIFQPFFTTKPSGKGTGLGLSLSYDIVKSHGGELSIKTKKDQGTEFTILLPI